MPCGVKAMDSTNFAEGNDDEGTLVHQRMGYLQVGLIDVEVVVEQDVDVDGAVVVERPAA